MSELTEPPVIGYVGCRIPPLELQSNPWAELRGTREQLHRLEEPARATLPL